jgi:AcrR family transcriptional regulator
MAKSGPPATSTSQRKAREIAAREELIVKEARSLLLQRGYQGWNMDDLAQAVEYSKGTLYQHFQSKEDLTLAVSSESLRHRAELFERAATFEGASRERIRAVCLACCEFAARHPEFFHADMMLKSVSFWEKANPQRQEHHRLQGQRCWRVVNQMVVEAMALGDLPRRYKPEDLTFSLIAVVMGSHIAAMETDIRISAGITDPLVAVRRNGDILCDGMNWRLLSHEHDYAAVDQKIIKTIFPGASWFSPT